jgi:hypothetical protein
MFGASFYFLLSQLNIEQQNARGLFTAVQTKTHWARRKLLEKTVPGFPRRARVYHPLLTLLPEFSPVSAAHWREDVYSYAPSM